MYERPSLTRRERPSARGLITGSGNSYHPSSLRNSRGTIMKIDGRCHCGYVTFEAEADPETTTICNCTDCQTMSGAPLRAVIITRPSTFVLLSGKPTEYRKTADSGNVRVQGFCPQCGTALYATSVGDEPKAYGSRVHVARHRRWVIIDQMHCTRLFRSSRRKPSNCRKRPPRERDHGRNLDNLQRPSLTDEPSIWPRFESLVPSFNQASDFDQLCSRPQLGQVV